MQMDKRVATQLAQGASPKKLRTSLTVHNSSSVSNMLSLNTHNGGFCGALQRTSPTMSPSLARKLANKENFGLGKVKVMLRIGDINNDTQHFMSIDKKARQITLTDLANSCSITSFTSQERGPMVAAPKIYAFDGLFTPEDQQSDVCSCALSEIIPAVLEGYDGCLLSIGYPNSGQMRTMLGKVNPPSELGAIPCAISWLYKGIHERRQKTGARFSVRVSAQGISATRPEMNSRDLLTTHATGSDDSPGVYLRDDFLGGPTELRAPTAERAALFLDSALNSRLQNDSDNTSSLQSALIFTLHVYQYNLSRKGGVAGGRSRLHLIDLGDCANRNGGLPLSGMGNILLSILSGQRHPPNKEHPLTPLLKDCLGPLTCHVSIMAHVLHSQPLSDALTTIQLASRIHRLRKRKHRFPISNERSALTSGINGGHQSTGSSTGSGAEPSSSELSADTVIYIGPSDDATDGEHPPIYLSNFSKDSEYNSNSNKPQRRTTVERQIPFMKATIFNKRGSIQKIPQSPTISINRMDSLKRRGCVKKPSQKQALPTNAIPFHSSIHSETLSKSITSNIRYSNISKGANAQNLKSSPLRRPGVGSTNAIPCEQLDCPSSPLRKISEEQWVDGPRVSRAKIAEARHLMREVNHIKQCETWVDGPKSQSSHSLSTDNLPPSISQIQGYGFMDAHKKTMIRQWVENQTSQIFQTLSATTSPTHFQYPDLQSQNTLHYLTDIKHQSIDNQKDFSNIKACQHSTLLLSSNIEKQQGTFMGQETKKNEQLQSVDGLNSAQSRKKYESFQSYNADSFQNNDRVVDCDEDQDSGPSEVPPALPLIEPLGSRDISHESLHRILKRHVSRETLLPTQNHSQHHEFHHGLLSQQSSSQTSHNSIDYGMQVTEEEITLAMNSDHPLIATASSLTVIGDAFSDCSIGERTRSKFDQLARLREIFTSQLAMAEMTPSGFFNNGCDVGSVYSEPACYITTGPGSVCSEPLYNQPSPIIISQSPSQNSLPSLNGIMQIADMDHTSLRHPDGASDPNLLKNQKCFSTKSTEIYEIDKKATAFTFSKRPLFKNDFSHLPVTKQAQLPLLPLNTSEVYDSGQDSSTPRTSKHSGISRRAESGYHSVGTVRDSDESSFISGLSKERHNRIILPVKKKPRQEKGLCNWLINPFTCTYTETEGEISDF